MNALRQPRGDASIRPLTLDEVHAAVRSLRSGEFRGVTAPGAAGVSPELSAARRRPAPVDDATWVPQPHERVVAVIGAAGCSGASTLALALGMAAAAELTPAGISVRVIECCSADASGLAAASGTELGSTHPGWQQGRRDGVQIQRADRIVPSVNEVSAPPVADHRQQMTIFDIGWDPCHLTGTDSWVRTAVAASEHLVVTATATVPGLLRLQTSVQLLTEGLRPVDGRPLADRLWLAILGPRRRKWPPGVQSAGGPAIARLVADGRSVEVPTDRSLAFRGLDSRALPAPVRAAASDLLRQWAIGDDSKPWPGLPASDTAALTAGLVDTFGAPISRVLVDDHRTANEGAFR